MIPPLVKQPPILSVPPFLWEKYEPPPLPPFFFSKISNYATHEFMLETFNENTVWQLSPNLIMKFVSIQACQ